MKRLALALASIAVFGAAAGVAAASKPASDRIRVYSTERKDYVMVDKVVKTEAEWKKELPPEVFRITRQGGTELAFTGAYWNHHAPGVYRCADCGNDLFTSKAKYESGTGWPSFWQPVAPENVATRGDQSLMTGGTEVVCARCGAHLGHIFDDGPKPTGLRYCINSAALTFEKTK